MWLGTTWEKQEGRFLLGSSSSYTFGSIGGSSSVTLTKANLPATKLQLDSFSLGRGTQEITGNLRAGSIICGGTASAGAFKESGHYMNLPGGTGLPVYSNSFQASRSWTGMSTSAAPYTTNMGDSTPFNNMPPYMVCNIWKRLT